MVKLPISVIIPAKNAERTIEDCLSSVQRDDPAEIIVVDGNSSDRTVEIARIFTDRIYYARGVSCARQLGAEKARQEYIAYVDSDVVLTDGALATMLAEFQGSGYVSIGAQQLLGTRHLSYWEWAQWQHSQYSQLRHHKGYIVTMACLWRRKTILKYGFDPFFPSGEDADLQFRLSRERHRFGISSVFVYHHYATDLKSFFKTRFWYGRGGARMVWKHGVWHFEFWPPLTTSYWLIFCLIRGKLRLIPYLVVSGIAETAGMVKGFAELIGYMKKRVDR